MVAQKADKPIEPNPLYKRLMHGAKPPTLAQTVVLTVILFMISAALVMNRIPTPLPLIEMIVIILIPPVVAGSAALITIADAQTEAFILQNLTLLTSAVIVGGYARAALFRTRLLFALVVGLLPMLFYNTPASLSAPNTGCDVFVSRSEFARMPTSASPPCAAPGDIRFFLEGLLQAAVFFMPVLAAPAAALYGVWRGAAVQWAVAAVGMSIVVPIVLVLVYMVPLSLLTPVVGTYMMCLSPLCPKFHIWTDYAWILAVSLIIVAFLTYDVYGGARQAV